MCQIAIVVLHVFFHNARMQVLPIAPAPRRAPGSAQEWREGNGGPGIVGAARMCQGALCTPL